MESGSTTNYSTENVNLTVWAAEENKDGHVAVAVDKNIVPGTEEHPAPTTTKTVNEEATKALEASINYIVKISTDCLQKVTAAGAKTEVESNTAVTTTENEDGSVTETTEKTETVKVTERVTGAEGNITESLGWSAPGRVSARYSASGTGQIPRRQSHRDSGMDKPAVPATDTNPVPYPGQIPARPSPESR